MNAYMGPNLLHVHAVTPQRAMEAAAEKDRRLLQAGATLLPFGIDHLPIPHGKSVFLTALAGIASFIAGWRRAVPTGRLPMGEPRAQPAS